MGIRLAETFVSRRKAVPTRLELPGGPHQGFARHNGTYTDPHKVPRRCSCAHLRMQNRPECLSRTQVTYSGVDLRELFAALPDSKAGDSAGHLRPGAIVGAHGTVRETAQQEASCAGCLAQPDRGPLGGTIGPTILVADTERLSSASGAPRFAGTAAIPRSRRTASASAASTAIRTRTFETVENPNREPTAATRGVRSPRPGRLEDVDVRGCLITGRLPRQRAVDSGADICCPDSRRSPPSTGTPRPSGITSPNRSSIKMGGFRQVARR